MSHLLEIDNEVGATKSQQLALALRIISCTICNATYQYKKTRIWEFTMKNENMGDCIPPSSRLIVSSM